MDLSKTEKELETRRACYEMFAQGLLVAVVFPDSAHREIVTISPEREGQAYINGVQFAFWLTNRQTLLDAAFHSGEGLGCFGWFAEGFRDAVNGKYERRPMSSPDLAKKRLDPEDFSAWQQEINAYNNGLELAWHMAYGPGPEPIRVGLGIEMQA